MPRNDDEDEAADNTDDSNDDSTEDSDTSDDSDNDNSTGNAMSDNTTNDETAVPGPDDAAEAVSSASPEEDDAHRGMLGEVLNVLDGQGIDVNQLADQYGLPHMDVNNMSAGQIVQLTQKLAQDHPEIVQEISQQFPMAQGLLGMLTGGQNSGGAGGIVGGLLGRFLH